MLDKPTPIQGKYTFTENTIVVIVAIAIVIFALYMKFIYN